MDAFGPKLIQRPSHATNAGHSLPPDVANPSEDAILEVIEKIEMAKIATSRPYDLGYNLGDGRFVKISGACDYSGYEEARVMDFIRLHTTIPVPRVHMVFERGEWFYNVMDYVAGELLSTCYKTYSPEKLEDIANQLSDIIRRIRAIDIPHQTVLGTWEAKPFRNTWFKGVLWDRNAAPSNTFESVGEFNSYWLRRSKLQMPFPDAQGVKIVPSHGDLNDGNIIIRDEQIVAILDWDTFGWYPDFWELIPSWNARWTDAHKWEMALEKVFGPKSEFCARYVVVLDSAFQEPADYDMATALLQLGTSYLDDGSIDNN